MSEQPSGKRQGQENLQPRHDPPGAPVDGDLRADQFTNQAKDRNYVCVHKNNADQMNYYSAIGYVVETYRADGPRPKLYRASSSRDGSEIEVMGHILMSCPIEQERARRKAQSDRADMVDRQILAPGGVEADGLRGMRGMRVENTGFEGL